MMNWTTDHVKNATKKFFEEQELTPSAERYCAGSRVQKVLAEGYNNYQYVLAEAKRTAPEELKTVAEEVAEKLSMTQAEYNQVIVEVFKCKLAEIMIPAAAYIPVKDRLEELLGNQEDENLILLVMSSMEDILESMTNRFANIVTILIEGVPMEIAEKIAEEVGDAQVIPVEVKVNQHGASKKPKDGCCGECGGHCDCKRKEGCKKTGHCQY